MGPDPKIFDDLARMAGGAVNLLSGMQQQIREEIRVRIEDMATRMDLVPREDIDLLQARIDALETRIKNLENRKPVGTTSKKKKSAPKSGKGRKKA